jgi:lipopolysaccharide export system permease protein
MKQLMFQLAKEKIDKGIKEHQFTEALGNLVVYVEKIDKDTGTWHDVWVSDMRGQVMPVITIAKTGKMYTEPKKMQVTIILDHGSIHRASKDQSQIITFNRYSLYIPFQPPNQDPDKISRGAMTMAQLQNMAEKFGPDTVAGRECLVHYHKRLVLPVGCLLLSLIGLSLGLQSGPGKPAIGVPMGLAFYIIYYVIFTFCKRMSESSSLPVWFTMWIPNIMFLLIMLYMIRQTANERPFIAEHIKDKLRRVFSQVKPATYGLLRIKFKIPKKTEVKTTYSEEMLAQFSATGKIHGNAKSRVFHLPECEFYNCKNCTIEFKDLETAFLSGFEPCRFCKEILGGETL